MNLESVIVCIVFLGTLTWIAIAATLPDSVRETRKLYVPLLIAFLGCFAFSGLVGRFFPDFFNHSSTSMSWIQTLPMWIAALIGVISLVRRPASGRTLYLLPRRGRVEFICLLLLLGLVTLTEIVWGKLVNRQDWIWLAGLNVIAAAVIKIKAGHREICEKGLLLRREVLYEWKELASYDWISEPFPMLRLRFRDPKKHGFDMKLACPPNATIRQIFEERGVPAAEGSPVDDRVLVSR